MDHAGSQDSERFRDAGGMEQRGGCGSPSGIERSIRPGTAVPPTVLVGDMGDGSLLLAGWRDGPSAYLCPADAVPLRRELASAFSPDLPPNRGQGEAP